MKMSREYRVIHPYRPRESDELLIKKGDIIADVVEVEEGWLEGLLNGTRGIFPDNFVEPISPVSNIRSQQNNKNTTNIETIPVVKMKPIVRQELIAEDNRPLHKAGIQERIAKLKQSSITIQNPISKTHDSKLVHHHTSVPTNNDSIAVFNVNNDLKSSSFTKERLDKHINEPTQNIESDYLNRMKGYENKPIQPVDKEKNINVNSDIKKKEKCDIKPLENYNEYRAQIPHKRKPKTIFNHDMQPDNSFPKWDNVESKEIKPDVYISSKSPVKPKHTDKSEKSLKKHSIPEEMFTIATNVAKDITKNYVSKVKFDEYVVDTNSKFEKLYTAYKEKINSITKEMDEETKKRKIMEVSLKRIYNLALENNWNLEK